MASLKRKTGDIPAAQSELKKAPGSRAKQRVALNPADCSLDFNIDNDGLHGSGFHEGSFGYCWSGARANTGINGGKYCFGCKIVSVQRVDVPDIAPEYPYQYLIGVSRGEDPVENLGETRCSFVFAEALVVGDTVVCAVDLESEPRASVGFYHNGQWSGVAMEFEVGPILGQGESALFPHVLLKNVVVELQFCLEDGLVPEGGFKPWDSAIEDGNAVRGPKISNISDCEVMMTVGLPASGKTYWAEKWIQNHPEKRYVLLTMNAILDKMKLPEQQNDRDQFDRLMDEATTIFCTLWLRAAKTPRNYIFDDTNVHKSARIRRLRPFALFKKIAVVVFPCPEELKSRTQKRFRETGKKVADHAVDSMIVNFVLPTNKTSSDDCFNEVMYEELNREECQGYLNQMMKEALARLQIWNLENENPSSYPSMNVIMAAPQNYSTPTTHSNHNCLQGSRGGQQQYPLPDVPCGYLGCVLCGNSGLSRTISPAPRSSLGYHGSYQSQSDFNQPNMHLGAIHYPAEPTWRSTRIYGFVGQDLGGPGNPASAPPFINNPAGPQFSGPWYRNEPHTPPPLQGWAPQYYPYPRHN